MGAKKHDDIGEPTYTASEISELRNLKVSYLRHARLKLGLQFYQLDGIKFKLSDVDSFVESRKKKHE
jgi:hypothetical protein